MSLYGGESAGEGRPYTLGTFQNKLNKFEDLIKDMTYQGAEATPEERRQMITGRACRLCIRGGCVSVRVGANR